MSVASKLALIRYGKHCSGKVRHKSEGAAQAHLRALSRVDSEPMAVYKCVFCRCWHVGHVRRGKPNG